MPAQLDAMMGVLEGAFRGGSPIPDDAALAARCAEHVSGNDRLTPAEQADIYRRQFWLRHLDALLDDYPGLRHVLGEDAVETFFRAYLAAHPPVSYTLRDLGNDLVRFAQGHDGFPDGLGPLARDMVRYENALIDLFDGAAPPALDKEKVTATPPEAWTTARIVLSPLLARLKLDHPVHDVRRALKQGESPPLPSPRPVHLLAFRPQLIIQVEEVDPLAFALLDALAQGVPLAPACDRVAAGLDDAAGAALAAQVGPWFEQWTAWGLFIDVVTDPPSATLPGPCE